MKTFISLDKSNFLLRCFVRTQAVDVVYAFAVVMLLVNIDFGRFSFIFRSLGKRSMFMWMIHPFLVLYLFPSFFFGFYYPVLIFAVVTVVSYLLAIMFDYIKILLLPGR